jgi:hypothetical protein
MLRAAARRIVTGTILTPRPTTSVFGWFFPGLINTCDFFTFTLVILSLVLFAAPQGAARIF